MKLYEVFIMAWNDILNRKARSFLTIMAISIGSMLLVGMLGLGDAILKSTKELTKNLGMVNEISVRPISYNEEASGEESQISISLKDKIGIENEIISEVTNLLGKKKNIYRSQIKEINEIGDVDYTVAYIKSRFTGIELAGNGVKTIPGEAIGIALDFNNDIKEKVTMGRSTLKSKDEILVGEGVLSTLGIKNYSDIIGKEIKIHVEYPEFNGATIKEPIAIKGTVVGIIDKKSKYSSNIIMSDEKIEPVATYFTGEGNYIDEYGYDGVWVFVKYGKSVTKVADKIIEKTGLVAFSFQMISALVDVLNGVVKMVLSFGGIVVLLVASLGLVNTMTMTIQEKKTMIGVMRAVGASKSNIKAIFIAEGFIIGAIGGALGVLFSFGVLHIINILVAIPRGMVIPVTFFNASISMIVTIVIIIIASLIPASKASKADVIKTLCEE